MADSGYGKEKPKARGIPKGTSWQKRCIVLVESYMRLLSIDGIRGHESVGKACGLALGWENGEREGERDVMTCVTDD